MSADAQRAKIVSALNLSPLVPPQADNATLDIVNDAWMALSEMCQRQQRVQEKAKAARSIAAAPDYDEQAIKDALWAVVDEVLG